MSLPLVFPRYMLPSLRACALRQDWFLSREHEQRIILLTNAAYSEEDVTKRVPLVIQVTDTWNVHAFPSTAWEQTAALPIGAAIYYVLNRDSGVLYVGASKQVRQRWLNHHRRSDLAAVGATRIAWQAVWPEFLPLEALFISYCRPLHQLPRVQQPCLVEDPALTPLDYLHRYWRQVAPADRLRFLCEMLTPNERRAIQLGMEEGAEEEER